MPTPLNTSAPFTSAALINEALGLIFLVLKNCRNNAADPLTIGVAILVPCIDV